MRLIIKKPIISEKSIQQGVVNKYTFLVDDRATKGEVAVEIAKIFKVKVKDVNMVSIPGKKKRFKKTSGKRSDIRKAVVTLMPGNRISLFEEGTDTPEPKETKKKTTKKEVNKEEAKA